MCYSVNENIFQNLEFFIKIKEANINISSLILYKYLPKPHEPTLLLKYNILQQSVESWDSKANFSIIWVSCHFKSQCNTPRNAGLCLVCEGFHNKIPQTGGLNNRIFSQFWMEAGSLRSRCQWGGLFLMLLGLHMAFFMLYPHVAFSLCLGIPGVSPLLIWTPVTLD